MTPETIIRDAEADGVRLGISPTGTIRATGDSKAVGRWSAVIREFKPGIVKALLEQKALTGELSAIREWLTCIGEADPAIISEVMERCHRDSDARDYFVGRAAAELIRERGGYAK